MRLLNVNTFKLEEFVGDQVQVITYAILSHTWEGKEVTFQDIQQQDAVEKLEHPPNSAWAKIKNSCAQARKDGFGHIWIDTCCIDKSSSAELQEAINSMFNWYLESMVCYAYLSDVPPTPGSDIAVSRWFTRGWTLQELLAPNHITFFDCTWTPRGQRGDSHLLGKISSKTRINTQVLAERERLHYHRRNPDIVHRFLRKISVAEKMSWAADRETTRIEDQAYCLLGLFDINMPMLYGEGDKAFKRLQHELMRATDDCTLLAWGYGQRTRELRDLEPFHAEVEPPMPIGILARAPTDFRHAGDLVPCRIGPFGRPSFSLSQRGITMSLPVRDDPVYNHIKYGILGCQQNLKPEGTSPIGPRIGPFLILPLIRTSFLEKDSYPQDEEYTRASWSMFATEPFGFIHEAKWSTISIRLDANFSLSAGVLLSTPRLGLILDFAGIPCSARSVITQCGSVYPAVAPTKLDILLTTCGHRDSGGDRFMDDWRDSWSFRPLGGMRLSEKRTHIINRKGFRGKFEDAIAIQLCSKHSKSMLELVVVYRWEPVDPIQCTYKLKFKCRAKVLPISFSDREPPSGPWLESIWAALKEQDGAFRATENDEFWARDNGVFAEVDLGGDWKFKVLLRCNFPMPRTTPSGKPRPEMLDTSGVPIH